MRRYKGDPRWMTARFESACQCGKRIKQGEQIYYFPLTKTALCQACGEPAHRRFVSAAQDEATMTGQCW